MSKGRSFRYDKVSSAQCLTTLVQSKKHFMNIQHDLGWYTQCIIIKSCKMLCSKDYIRANLNVCQAILVLNKSEWFFSPISESILEFAFEKIYCVNLDKDPDFVLPISITWFQIWINTVQKTNSRSLQKRARVEKVSTGLITGGDSSIVTKNYAV